MIVYEYIYGRERLNRASPKLLTFYKSSIIYYSIYIKRKDEQVGTCSLQLSDILWYNRKVLPYRTVLCMMSGLYIIDR